MDVMTVLVVIEVLSGRKGEEDDEVLSGRGGEDNDKEKEDGARREGRCGGQKIT